MSRLAKIPVIGLATALAIVGLLSTGGTVLYGVLGGLPKFVWFYVAWAFAFFLGFLFIPLLVYFAAPSFPLGLRTVFGRILFTITQLTAGAGVLVERDIGGYDYFVADINEDKDAVITIDGEEQVIDRDDVGWSYLGIAPLAITWEKSEKALRNILATDIELDEELAADGGEFVVEGRERGEYPLFRRVGEKANWNVSLDAMHTWLGSKAGGPGLAQRAEEQTLKNHGGTGGLSSTAKLVGMILCLLIGVITGYVGLML